jgi:hypothetical protein
MLPTMEANTRTPTRKSKVTKRYSALCTGIGVSPSRQTHPSENKGTTP